MQKEKHSYTGYLQNVVLGGMVGISLLANSERMVRADNNPPNRSCQLFECGPFPAPTVKAIFVNRNPDASLNTAFKEIIEDGYLDRAQGTSSGTFQGYTTITVPEGILRDTDIKSMIVQLVTPGVIPAFILGQDVVAVQHENQLTNPPPNNSYHDVANGTPYFVVQFFPSDFPQGIISNIPLDYIPSLFAHELVEAVADKEIADPCDFYVQTYENLAIQMYVTIDGTCGMGTPHPKQPSENPQ